MYETLKEIGQT